MMVLSTTALVIPTTMGLKEIPERLGQEELWGWPELESSGATGTLGAGGTASNSLMAEGHNTLTAQAK